MNGQWNLDRLYSGFDDPRYVEDFARLEKLAEEYNQFAKALNGREPLEGLREGIRIQEAFYGLGEKMFLYPELRSSVNVMDTEADSHGGRVMSLFSGSAGAGTAFREWACGIEGLMDLVRGDEYLKDYEFLFKGMVDAHRYALSVDASQVQARMEMSGSNAWAKLHGYLTSTVRVNYRDQVTNLSNIRNLAYDPDPQVRKDAYEAELACYEAIREPAAHALNAIKLETISDCRLRGYESPLERTLKQSDMQRATLDAMLGAMDEYLPKFWQYLKAKAKLLGHEGGLPWYDLFAPVGKLASSYSVKEARDFLLELFGGFDREQTEMIRRAFDEEWIDFYPREGKAGGAFCAEIHALGESRILTNYDGTFSDIVTLAHELGHAFHNQCVNPHRVLNRNYSMPLAETASTFNECVVMGAAIAAAKDRQEKLALIESQLQDVTQVICDIYSRYRFETMVFENRENRFMDSAALCGFMTEAQKLSYGDGLDHNVMHPYMWICKGHYYGPTFYNFPYAFGALFSRGLYALYEKEGEKFVDKYKNLLYTTPVATAEDVAKVAGIDLTDRSFWRGALETIAQRIDQFCELAEV